jgi:hypothetical protein
MKKPVIAIALLTLAVIAAQSPAAEPGAGGQVLVEAEGFTDYGGWSLDTQFIKIMGSPGTYKVFVRTKDWVAHRNAPGRPGRFQAVERICS